MIKGLYIHLPFCETICSYCDFPKYVLPKSMQRDYLDALLIELYQKKDSLANIQSVYIGGGTPSYLELPLLEELLQTINDLVGHPITEFSIETNPRDITPKLCTVLKENHVNRVSIGVQTFEPRLLKIIGRTHQIEDVKKALDYLRNHQITNINLDIMAAIPSQTIQEFKSDLEIALSYDTPHISLYSFILEEKTLIYHQIKKKEISLTNEDDELEMMDYAKKRLQQKGLVQYEISNFAKPKFESIHNLLYWSFEEYIGVGLSAVSFIQNKRMKNQSYITRYIDGINNHFSIIEETEEVDGPSEYMFMGLRKTKGIDMDDFFRRFHKDVFAEFPEINDSIAQGLLKRDQHRLYLTQRGIYLSNQVFIHFIR